MRTLLGIPVQLAFQINRIHSIFETEMPLRKNKEEVLFWGFSNSAFPSMG